MNRRRLLELYEEFGAKLTELHTWYLDSIIGYAALYERLRTHQEKLKTFLGDHEFAAEDFQNTLGITYKDVSSFDFQPASTSPVMKQGELLHRVKKDGQNTILLGQQCIVAAYSYWEKYLRKEIEEALNRKVKCDFWGDMRHLRNSIVHDNGIASPHVSKCKIITWFKPLDVIALDHEKMHSIFMHMAKFRNEIHACSLPPQNAIHVSN